MTKIRKVKRKKTYRVNINRKRLRNKMRKLPNITCPQIKEAWELKKSTKSNLLQMGLTYDVNKALKLPETRADLLRTAKGHDKLDNRVVKRIPKKISVAEELEKEAKAPRERGFRLPSGQVEFLTYLMDKYDEDYRAMARDKRNHYQLTWKQIRSRINTFKSVPEQYAEYLVRKGEIVLDDPIPLEETRRKRAQENVKKYCKPKKVKPTVQWIEEDVEIETKPVDVPCDVVEDEKKLKLFSDEESSDEERFEDEDDGEFRSLSDLSDELSDDDLLDGDFSTDSDE